MLDAKSSVTTDELEKSPITVTTISIVQQKWQGVGSLLRRVRHWSVRLFKQKIIKFKIFTAISFVFQNFSISLQRKIVYNENSIT